MDVDETIARIGELQAGQIHREQLRSLGLGAGAIEYRRHRGALVANRWSVYGVGHRRTDLLANWHAALLTSGDGASLSHRAGGAHHGVRPPYGGDIEITVPSQRRPRDGIRYYRRSLPADEIVVVDGLPVTSPMRTLFDLAGVLSDFLFRRAVREVEVQGLRDHLSLVDLLRRHPRPPGAEAIRAAIAAGGTPATVNLNEGEQRFAELVASAGISTPAHRYGIAVEGDWFEVDFAWPDLRVAVEVDGPIHETPIVTASDRERDRKLAEAGWIVVRFTRRQLREDPGAVLRRLRAVLAAA
jgi:hypothetical protein